MCVLETHSRQMIILNYFHSIVKVIMAIEYYMSQCSEFVVRGSVEHTHTHTLYILEFQNLYVGIPMLIP